LSFKKVKQAGDSRLSTKELRQCAVMFEAAESKVGMCRISKFGSDLVLKKLNHPKIWHLFSRQKLHVLCRSN